jgi:hypothetical protein
MSEESCTCGCSTKPETDTRNSDDCTCGCGATGAQEPTRDVVA